MKTIPVDKLTTNFINLLEEIATTGDPIELDWQGKRFQILPVLIFGGAVCPIS